MLSETLANLTRRIAEEFDHLSDSDSPQSGSSPASDSLLATSPQKTPASSPSQQDPQGDVPQAAHGESPQPNSVAPDAPHDRPADAKRRPAKKATAATSDSTSAASPDEPSEKPREAKDWQRTVIN